MPAADQYEQQMLALINAERTKLRLEPLALNSRLNGSAEIHSKWMLDTDVFSHTGANGSSAGQRMTAADYVFQGTWSWGENIAWTSQGGAAGIADEVAQLHVALMNSPGHKANILNATYKEIGLGIEIGMFTTSGGQTYSAVMITQNFALSGADNGGDGSGLVGASGADSLTGTAAAEVLDGLAGNDTVSGMAGDDTIYGGLGNDRLFGDDNNDRLNGDLGNDVLNGGRGNDLVYAGDGLDRLIGGDGLDTLYGDAGADNLFGGAGHDRLFGGLDGDSLDGDAGADLLDGGDGDDRLFGDLGNDTLSGGNGKDQLEGGAGIDRLTGGSAEDSFVFRTGFGTDRVTDFADNVDTLAFDASYWAGIADATAFVDAHAAVVGSSVVFDFGNGDVLTVSGLGSLAQLYDDVMAIA